MSERLLLAVATGALCLAWSPSFAANRSTVFKQATFRQAAPPKPTAPAAATPDLPATTATKGKLALAQDFSGVANFNGDEDWYAVSLRAGRHYAFRYGLGSGEVQSALPRLYDAKGKLVARGSAFDRAKFRFSGGVEYTVPKTGTYYLGVKTTLASGAKTGSYTLTYALDVANDPTSKAVLTVGKAAKSTLYYSADADYLKVSLKASQAYDVTVDGYFSGTYKTPIFDAKGRRVVDAKGLGLRNVKVPATGTYFVGLVPVGGNQSGDVEYEVLLKAVAGGGPGEGDDVLNGTAGDDDLNGFGGNDTIHGAGGNDRLTGGPGSDAIYGDDGDDLIYGDDGSNTGPEDAGNKLYGGPGDDSIYGGVGSDRIEGGPGSDSLGGDGYGGNDTYVFAEDSMDGGSDQMYPIPGDKIDLSGIDADRTKPGDQAFTFIGDKPFTAPGQLRVYKDPDSVVAGTIELNVDADPKADKVITTFTFGDPPGAGDLIP